MCDRDGAEESARAAAPIGVDVEAVMTGFRANDRVSFAAARESAVARLRPSGMSARGWLSGAKRTLLLTRSLAVHDPGCVKTQWGEVILAL
jgi:hypothetical protein